MAGKFWSSASGIDRVIACPASAALPHLRETSAHAHKGQGMHTELEAACEPGTDPISVGGYSIERQFLRLPEGSSPEQAFSWDAVSGETKWLGTLKDARGYPEAPYSTLFGTADVMAPMSITLDEKPVSIAFLCDWKSGHPSFLPESDSWQMRVLAFMAAKCLGAGYAVTRITGVRDGFVSHKPQKLWTPEELAETEVILRKAYDAVNARARKGVTIADVSVGSHCHFCQAWRSCPANKELLRDIPGDVDETDLVKAFATWQQLKTAAQKFEETMKRVSSEEPVYVGGNSVYGKAPDGKFRKFRRGE